MLKSQLDRRFRRIAVVGLGAIGRVVMDRLHDADLLQDVPDCMALVRTKHMDSLGAVYGDRIRLVSRVDDIIAFAPDIVIEAAGQGAVREFAHPLLAAGLDLMIVSTGALVDDALRDRLVAAGQASGARLLIPAGAIAGLDGLGALKRSGGLQVRYTSTKPPGAWRGTPAETMIDLGAVMSPVVFFSGPAAEAARLFPKNANLAATIALAGAGLQDTMIDLVADPGASGNCGRIEATAAAGRLLVELSGPSMPGNPKTSLITAYSLLDALSAQGRTLVI